MTLNKLFHKITFILTIFVLIFIFQHFVFVRSLDMFMQLNSFASSLFAISDNGLSMCSATHSRPSTRDKCLRSDLSNSLHPKITPSLLKSGIGSKKPDQRSTPRPQVKSTRKNSINSPTLSSSTSVSAILLMEEIKEKKEEPASELDDSNPCKLLQP